jgi:quinol monooxygenase YgiN
MMKRLLAFALLISTAVFGAQTPAAADAAFYAVTYVEVMPASKASAVAAFKQYRDASRKEDGFIRFDFFEQQGRDGHFALIETWANPKALDAHAASAHAKEWRTKLDPIRLSDYDQRPYKTLTVSPAPAAAAGNPTYVIAHVDIGGQGTNAPELLRRLAETSRNEEGNLRFDVLQHAMRANHFTVIEAWRNTNALIAHAAAAHTRQYRAALGPISGSPLDERVYKVVD